MSTLRTLIEKHPLIVFFVVACGYSWGLWALMMASSRGWVPFYFPTNWTGSFGPSLAAIIVVALSQGKAGVRTLLRPIRHWRFGMRWYVFVLVGCVVPFVASLVIYAWLGHSIALSRGALINQLVQLPLFYPIILIIGGPLGEEIGWRGYALPRLLQQKSGLAASLFVFLMWMTWHLPLFWLEGASQQGSSIAVYVVMVAAFSVLFTWVYLSTSGSLLSVLLFHTTVNTFSYSLSQVSPALDKDPLLNWTVAIAFAVVALLVVVIKGPALSGKVKTSPGLENSLHPLQMR